LVPLITGGLPSSLKDSVLSYFSSKFVLTYGTTIERTRGEHPSGSRVWQSSRIRGDVRQSSRTWANTAQEAMIDRESERGANSRVTTDGEGLRRANNVEPEKAGSMPCGRKPRGTKASDQRTTRGTRTGSWRAGPFLYLHTYPHMNLPPIADDLVYVESTAPTPTIAAVLDAD